MENIEELKTLVEKYLNHSATVAERLRICRYIESETGMKQWFRSQIESVNGDIDEQVRDGILEAIYHDSVSASRRNWRFSLMSIAACLLAIVGTVATMDYLTAPAGDTHPFTVYTNMGNKSCVTLPDGTEVNLNTMSKITYRYDEKTGSRMVNLSGEAFFDVAKDPEHPFLVQADNISVEALGTKFNVNAYPESKSISVVLADGKVNVSSASEDMLMAPNTRIDYDKTAQRMTKHSVEAGNYCEWMNGYIYFNNERFDDITKLLSRNYGVTVNILSKTLKEEKFTGTIYQTDIKNVLGILTAASGAKYEVINDTLINLSY